MGDVLLTGPAVRAIAAGGAPVDFLASGAGAPAAAALPGVSEVIPYDAPWVGAPCDDAFAGELSMLIRRLRGAYDEAVIFTSFHQSPLPAAMVCRLAGITRISGTSDAAPGTLLDVRHRRIPPDNSTFQHPNVAVDDDGGDRGGHEVQAALRLAAAAGYPLPADDDGLLRLVPARPERLDLPDDYVVVHPGASVPARALGADLTRDVVRALVGSGRRVVLTGDHADRALVRDVLSEGPAADVTDLTGRTDLGRLRHVLAGARAVVVGNTGAAHLAAAVGTPVVSVFTPVVPAARWRPWGVPHALLGDQRARCAGSRARECPVPGHPCMRDVTGATVTAAVERLTLGRADSSESLCAS
nr:glycosyltransferase family 9 protein [Flexivirga aerilata]